MLRSGIYDGLSITLAAKHHHQVGDQGRAAVDIKLDDLLG